MSFDLRLDGARVVRPLGEPQIESVGVLDGRIAAIGELHDVPARRVIDLTGTYLLPGIIDTHVHIGFTDPVREAETETRSAAVGGVTTALIYYRSLDPYEKILPDFIDLMKKRGYIDFGIHLGILHDEHLARFDEYVQRFGLRSIKMYLAYKRGELRQFGVLGQDDGFVLDVFRAAARHSELVVNVHCENDDITQRGEKKWIQTGSSPVEQWSQARPPVAEAEAIQRVGLLAREAGNRVYIPHVSSGVALEVALEERRKGAQISVETCPHYLLADSLRDAGALAKVNPPVRGAADAVRLLAGLNAGDIDTIGTDHGALLRKDKVGDIVSARPGFPGVGMLLPALLHAVNQGLLSLPVIARAQARAAEIFGLAGKGCIYPGAQADLVAVDMSARRRVDAMALQGISDFSPYEGLEMTGWPVLTVRRGGVLSEGGQLVSQPGGEYVREWKA